MRQSLDAYLNFSSWRMIFINVFIHLCPSFTSVSYTSMGRAVTLTITIYVCVFFTCSTFCLSSCISFVTSQWASYRFDDQTRYLTGFSVNQEFALLSAPLFSVCEDDIAVTLMQSFFLFQGWRSKTSIGFNCNLLMWFYYSFLFLNNSLRNIHW